VRALRASLLTRTPLSSSNIIDGLRCEFNWLKYGIKTAPATGTAKWHPGPGPLISTCRRRCSSLVRPGVPFKLDSESLRARRCQHCITGTVTAAAAVTPSPSRRPPADEDGHGTTAWACGEGDSDSEGHLMIPRGAPGRSQACASRSLLVLLWYQSQWGKCGLACRPAWSAEPRKMLARTIALKHAGNTKLKAKFEQKLLLQTSASKQEFET
jgi:hypothetical protein